MYISLTIFLFRYGIAFYFHLLSTVQVTVRPKKYICVFTVTFQINLGSVGINFFFFFTIGKTGNSRSRFRYSIFEISGKPSFVEAVRSWKRLSPLTIYSAITKYRGVLKCVSCWVNEFARHLFMDIL